MIKEFFRNGYLKGLALTILPLITLLIITFTPENDICGHIISFELFILTVIIQHIIAKKLYGKREVK